MVTSSEDGTIKIWDTRTGSIQRNYDHKVPVNDVVIHPNQGELISCDRGGNVRVWDLGENKCTHQLVPEEDVSIASVTVASDGTLLCAGNNTVRADNLFPSIRPSNQPPNPFATRNSPPPLLLNLSDCAPHQSQLANDSHQGNVYVWRMLQDRDITSLIAVTSFQAHTAYITRVLLSPDVRHLATCSADHNARIWSVDPSAPHNIKGTENLPLERKPGAFPLETSLDQHQRWVWDCAFSADSAYLVTACSDHYARLWELSTQAVIRQYNGHHRGAVCVALNDYSETR